MLRIDLCLAAAVLMAAGVPSVAAENRPAAAEQMHKAGNDFAYRLYREFAADKGNVFFSPYSVTVAMAMTLEGARGQTAAEMEKTLGLPGDEAARRDFFRTDTATLGPRLGVEMANAFWAQPEHKFLSRYTRALKKYYNAEAYRADFASAPERSRLEINSWTSDKTHGRIAGLFPKDSLNNLTRLVLVDAVYFKGAWAAAFDKSDTADADFFVSTGSAVKVKMMSLTGDSARFNYAETGGLQLLELPYKNSALAMLVVLPRQGGMKELEDSLSPDKVADWDKALYKERVNVFLPRFILNARYDLPVILSRMGMPTAFTLRADFSGMDGNKDLYIQQAVHQGFVEVNEEGTEAAAATGVAMALKSMPMPPSEFRADRPFLFLIRERGTGRVIFMGRVQNP